MKKLLTVIMALACFALTSYAQKNVEKQLIGKWCNPYKTRERIEKLTSDSLRLVMKESSPRLVFLYVNKKTIKKLVTPEVAPDKK